MMSTITYVLVLTAAMATISHAEYVCPGFGFIRPQTPCVDQCSYTNDTCGTGLKCCYSPMTPCGYRCVVPKNNVPKAGTCPSQDSEQSDPNWYLCDGHFCDVDTDCPCKKKCCRNKCGTPLCMSPVKTVVGKETVVKN